MNPPRSVGRSCSKRDPRCCCSRRSSRVCACDCVRATTTTTTTQTSTIAASADSSELASLSLLLRVLRAAKLLRLLRLARLFRLLERWREAIGLSHNLQRLFKLLFVMLIFAHWDGCALFLLSCVRDRISRALACACICS